MFKEACRAVVRLRGSPAIQRSIGKLLPSKGFKHCDLAANLGTAVASELARLKSENQLILDAVPAMIWFKDRENCIVRCNRMAAATAGVSVEEMQGQPTSRFYPDEAGLYFAADLEVMKTGIPRTNIIEPIMVKGREKRWIRTDKIPYRNELGEIVGVVVFSVDITAQRLAEEQREVLLIAEQLARREAEAANRVKDEFLAMLSHELRTPLMPIIGWAEQLQLGTMTPEERSRALYVIEKNTRLLGQLIDDLLDISRVTSGKLGIDLIPVELGALALEAIDRFREQAENRGIRLCVGELDHCQVLGDALRLSQVLNNLLTNALKFTQPHGEVRIEVVSTSQGKARVTVRDDGRGMTPEFLAKAFDRFSQEDDRSGRRHGGLGLGLAIVKSLVDMHGGTVAAASGGLGKGSTFTIELALVNHRAGT